MPTMASASYFPARAIFPSATWKAAEVLGAPCHPRAAGSAGATLDQLLRTEEHLRLVSFARALDPEGVPPGFFKDKIVMVGGRSAIGYLATGRDEFATPYTRRGDDQSLQFTNSLQVSKCTRPFS